MNLNRWLRRRRIRPQIDALWKPEYEALAWYNRARSRGLVGPDPAMEAVQRRYTDEYLPAADALFREMDAA